MSKEFAPRCQPTGVLLGGGENAVETRCTVGLLTWNAGDDGSACVRSLLAQTERPVGLVWIDNGSADGTPERLAGAFPEIGKACELDRNIGFCSGHNLGLSACTTRYYLALNQDVVLAPEYIERLCDWMDARPELALVSGLILDGGDPPRVASAGLVYPRTRFPYELGMDGPDEERWRGRRIVPGVTGAAMVLRVEACRGVSLAGSDAESEIFPPDFFAYHEEVDLVQRLARVGLLCGVEGSAVATHGGQGSGGLATRRIRAGYFANHWLLTLRHESWGMILRELPWLLKGELRHWLPRYLKAPAACARGVAMALGRAADARRFYRAFEAAHGPTGEKLAAARAASLKALQTHR